MQQIHRYDIAFSFAGEDREYVERLANLLRRRGVKVFYDEWERSELWGKDLFQYLDAIYRTAARYCVVFISEAYTKKAWAHHELKSAQARAFEGDSDYILPIRLDDSDLPGMRSTVGYIDGRKVPVSQVCELIMAKLGVESKWNIAEMLESDDDEDRLRAIAQIALERATEHSSVLERLMLSDKSDVVRARAAWALDNLSDERSLSAFVAALRDPSWEVRSNAGWGLVHLGEIARKDVEHIAKHGPDEDAIEMAMLILQRLPYRQ